MQTAAPFMYIIFFFTYTYTYVYAVDEVLDADITRMSDNQLQGVLDQIKSHMA